MGDQGQMEKRKPGIYFLFAFGLTWACWISAIFLAETKMWQLEKEYAYKEDMTTGESTGYFDPPFHQFDWETEVQEEDRLVEYHLRVTIRWKHRDRDQEFTVRSLAPMRRNERDLK